MEHLSLEVFNLDGLDSQYANLPKNANITITDTSDIFDSGDVWSHPFTLNVHANAHIFGTSGELHGCRLHDIINKRKARLWVDGLPLYMGFLRLADEVEVDQDGNVDVIIEGGKKTFDEMIDGTSAQEVSVGDVVIGVAINRKRVSVLNSNGVSVLFNLDGLEPYATKYPQLKSVSAVMYDLVFTDGTTPHVQRWPKLVKSHGEVLDSTGTRISPTPDYTNIQTPYDASHPFCNINICYQLKVNDNGDEKVGRGYTVRLARGKETTDGGDNQTRFNNSPNFYLLYFIDRLFKDLGIYIEENQAKNVEDLRRVFMLNYGCHYEEIEDSYSTAELNQHTTPLDLKERYGQYYIPLDNIVKYSGRFVSVSDGMEYNGKVLLRDVEITERGDALLSVGSLEGKVNYVYRITSDLNDFLKPYPEALLLDKTPIETSTDGGLGYYSAYLAYATGENYPNVEISEVIQAMKSMFGVRLLFSDDYKRVRIVLLRNIFRSNEVQKISCETLGGDVKVENSIRGFRMTYGKGTDSTSYYYKGFDDMLPKASSTWKDTTDKHDYSQWKLDADYGEVKQSVSAFNKKCYVTPVNGNAYGTQVDENEDVLFPSLFEWAGYMDAEDGDCTGEKDTIEEVQCNATPVLMNEVGAVYASLFSGDLKAPAPEITGSSQKEIDKCWEYVSWLATYGRITPNSVPFVGSKDNIVIKGNLDVFLSEGFKMRLLDNYSVTNVGTPFDDADPGLCFGVMRGSGADSYIFYDSDRLENEDPMNDYWEVTPGSWAISHPDTCDSYGNLWDYDGSNSTDSSQAISIMRQKWYNSNFDLINRTSTDYLTRTFLWSVYDGSGNRHNALFALGTVTSIRHTENQIEEYVNQYLNRAGSISDIYIADLSRWRILISLNSSIEEAETLKELQKIAFEPGYNSSMVIDNGEGSLYGRFSLKLRAEKPNPFFDPKQPENNTTNRRYLQVKNENLRKRGLCDQFYKEYSYWVRNARIVKREVRMELAQLLSIDKTKRVTVGDVTGFIRKTQYSVSNETGLGNVTIEIAYI